MLTQHFPPQPGVHADRWEWMGRALREAGHELDVVVPMWRNQPRLTVDDPRLEVHEVRALVPGLGLRRRITNEALALAQSLLLALRTPRPDVVLATVPALSTLPLGWAVSHLRRAPLLLELRDAWPHLLDEMASWNDDGTTSRPPAPGGTAVLAGPLARLMWRMERHAGAVVVTSESLRKGLEADGFAPVLLARNVALRPGRPVPLREPDGELHVLYLGSFGRAQKLATAVRAAAIAHRAGVSVRLRLVGSGVHEVPLRHLAERLGAPVDFVERVDGGDVAEHYAWADSVLVMLRGWSGMELTVPSKLYEALASGRHVSASVTGEAARIVVESGAGDVTAPDDAEALAALWQELASDPSRLRVGEGGRRWVEQWATPERGAATMLQALELAADQHGQHAGSRGSHGLGPLLQDAALTLGTIASHLDGDSATFFVQLARRTGLARRVRTGRGPRAWQVVAAHLADRPDELQRTVAAWAERSPGTGPLDRFAAAAALAHGHHDLVPKRLVGPDDRARRELQAGDLHAALAEAGPSTRLGRRIQGTLDALQPGHLAPPARGPRPGWRPDQRRVLHVLTNSLPHTRSGSTLRSQAIMQAQQRAGWRVEAATRLGYPVTIGRLGAPRSELVDGVLVHRLVPWQMPAATPQRLAEQARRLARLVERSRPAVLHTTTDYTNGLVTEAVARRFGLPWVYEMRGQLELTWLSKRPEQVRERAEHSDFLRLQRDRETACALAADAVVVLSEVQKDDLVARGVPAERISVVPNAVDEHLLQRSTSPREARERLGIEADASWIGAVSSLVGYEGFGTTLEAVALLRGEGRDVRCALVGDGTERPALQQRARELGIEGVCVFPGRVGREEALSWVEALDVVTVPRRDTPVCRVVTPMKPVEAMALGRAVVASDLPALRELLEPSGLPLVPAGDASALAAAVAGLLDDPQATQEHVAKARAWAARRTWQHAAEVYDRLYRTLEGNR